MWHARVFRVMRHPRRCALCTVGGGGSSSGGGGANLRRQHDAWAHSHELGHLLACLQVHLDVQTGWNRLSFFDLLPLVGRNELLSRVSVDVATTRIYVRVDPPAIVKRLRWWWFWRG